MSIFYDPYSPKDVNQRNLPHWSQCGRLHFVTFRLADSIPIERAHQLDSERQLWLAQNTQPRSPESTREYLRLFCDRVEGWLDDNVGECQLARADCASIVAGSLGHFDEKRYRLDHWVIMPNHVHVLVLLSEGVVLGEILHSWKSYTANKINRCCDRAGQLWQHESFDHIVRSESQLAKLRGYVIDNALKSSGRGHLSTQMVQG